MVEALPPGSGLDGYHHILTKILEVCERYKFIWEDKKGPLEFFRTSPSYNEAAIIGIHLVDGKFKYTLAGGLFYPKYFHQEINIEAVSEELKSISPDIEDFVSGFKKALGRRLAEHLLKRELNGLEKELLQTGN